MIYKKQFYILKKQSKRNGLPEDSGRPQRAAAFQGKPGYTAYTASKAAVDGMTKCLAQEWGRMGITVNSVWPSYMPGTMNRAQWGAEAEKREREMAEINPQGRNCSAELMSGLLTFLLSDSSSFVNGQIIACDGGWNCGHFTKALPQDSYDHPL